MLKITEENTDETGLTTGQDQKGRFTQGNPFGGVRANAGRKPMPEPRKQALEAFHKGLPEAVKYLMDCLRGNNPDDQKWACDLMIKKGIPNIDALIVHGKIEGASPADFFKKPALSPEDEEKARKFFDTLAAIEYLPPSHPGE